MATYYDSAEGERISKERVLQEFDKHQIKDTQSLQDFDAEVRPDSNGLYNAQSVLRWLGY